MEADLIAERECVEPCGLTQENIHNDGGPFCAVFHNNLVMRRIFGYLDTNSVMAACLVNKACRTAGRAVMRKRNVLAVVQGSRPCNQLLLLNDVVKASSDPPFLGISFQILEDIVHPRHRCTVYGSIAQLFPTLAKMNQVCVEVNCETNQRCVALDLMKYMLVEQGKAIRRICLTGLPKGIVSLKEFVGYQAQDFLPNLVAIKASNSMMQATLQLVFDCKNLANVETLVSYEHLLQLEERRQNLAFKTTDTPSNHLSRLGLKFRYRYGSPMRLPNLQIDWSRCLPNLKSVTLMFETGEDLIGPGLYGILNAAVFTPCLTVTDICIEETEKLCLTQDNLYNPIQNLEDLTVVFPRVTFLRINNVGTRIRAIFPLLFSWKKLFHVSLLRVNVSGILFNMDHVLCGIPIPMASRLMRLSPQQVQEQFSTWQTNPAGLRGLKDLRYLEIHLEHPTRFSGANQYPFHHKFFLTHVTGQIVFKAMPDLSVVILRQTCGDNCRYMLKQIEPYAVMHEIIEEQKEDRFDVIKHCQ